MERQHIDQDLTMRRMEAALFGNLEILGFHRDRVAVNIRLTPNMFQISNLNAGNVILHFLLTRLLPASRITWIFPPKKTCLSQMRKTVIEVLRELEAKGCIPPHSARNTTITAATGPRMVELLYYLSSHALAVFLARKAGGTGEEAPPVHRHVSTKSELVAMHRTHLASCTRGSSSCWTHATGRRSRLPS
ncbi:hypothetical protein CLOM_g18160 [Closterium sp. NIES-68]|nr:hypothetical protein CLOM_g18160 [Closterium sp. NIES-68]